MQLISKLILGTAQLGLPYGINNTFGKPSQNIVNDILATAYAKGIHCLDTAEAYGNSQDAIGCYHITAAHRFSVITKYNGHKTEENSIDFRKHFFGNLAVLNTTRLEGYLFHNFDIYKRFEYWPQLQELMQEKRLGKIGVSVYTNEQALLAANDNRISLIQLPFNLLDNNSQRENVLHQLKSKGKEVHTRSVFLQGLFYKNREELGKLNSLKTLLLQLDGIAQESGLTIGALAMAYCLRQPNIDKVLMGVETCSQLLENITMAENAALINEAVLKAIDKIQVEDATLLNPSNW